MNLSGYKEISCNLCGSKEYKIFSIQENPSVLHPRKVKCKKCGLVYSNPQATFEKLEEYYSNIYAHTGVSKIRKVVKRTKASEEESKEYFRRLNSRQPPGKFLDIGCNVGYMVKAANQMGWEGYGVELSKTYYDYATNVEGLKRIYKGDIFTPQFPDNFFDHLLAWHVIEHVTDAKQFLMEIRRIIKPGRELYIGTPHINGFYITSNRIIAKIKGEHYSVCTSIEHTYEFTPKTIKKILNDCGFQIVKLECYWPSHRERNRNGNWKGKLQDTLADFVASIFPDTKGYHMSILCKCIK